MATQFNTLCTSHSANTELLTSLGDGVAVDRGSSTSVKEIYATFITALDYRPEEPIADTNATYQSLLSEFSAYNTGGRWFQALCRESATLAELGYPDHSPEVRLQIARFTWYLIYVDDLGQKFPSFLEGFQECILTNKHPEGSFLQEFRAHLADMYHLWDTLPANCITLSGMDFINGCLLEQMPAIRDMRLSHHARSWPYFLRNKTGSAAAYAFMLFPKHLNIDMTVYVQVIEDIVRYTNLTNDILSFYKEDLAGERNNYMSNRANVTQRSVLGALQDTVDETLDLHTRITEILQHTDAYVPWKKFVNGYTAFHHTLKRYRLDDLGF